MFAFPIFERPPCLLALSVSLLASYAGAPCSLLLPTLPSAFLRLAKLTPAVPSPDLQLSRELVETDRQEQVGLTRSLAMASVIVQAMVILLDIIAFDLGVATEQHRS